MAAASWYLFRGALRSRRVLRRTNCRRRHLRLMIEPLEPRQLLHAGPHGGAGTLFDEHEAVMRLIDFDEIHNVAPGGATPNYFYVARDGDGNPTTPNYWSELSNWSIKTYDSTSNTPGFTEGAARHLPANGDD